MKTIENTSPLSQKASSKTDISVLLIFFNRPETFSQVFLQVRLARPSRLFLYQDGPRNEQDMEKVQACREIASQIDWECEVHKQYLDNNQGCDPSVYHALVWAFSKTDKLIILEDDCVPSLSFFPFCKEMLDRYENDKRVMMIAGFNADEVTPDITDDYFFTSAFSVWGWATWKRVADLWDSNYTFMQDEFNMRQLEVLISQRRSRPDIIRMFRDHSVSGKEYFETIVQAAMLFNSGLAVMPTKNQINNIGLTANSAHYSATPKTMPHRLRRLFTMKHMELDFPLKHPKFVYEDTAYKERLYRINAWGHPWIKTCYSIEELLLNLRYGNFRVISSAISNRLRKWTGQFKYK